ncbi:YihY/virulence factor BrkB family protein [Ornithinimicrobium sp. F0845]|uniref:YihY/virulence factor BrkB family protein n=1 Tax=Ornithinimicrobium sp. F0845 TaxID=2926412 RepID=UPI001FF5CC20|nr:YhjD/YihY/BrkB family envelope integrity protein [Ornithinimicrobium sp. F0845]MCK0111880.1 YihY/virulence factor BrkB family protein [Ornithinimicrobium sp. F0845]
MTVRRRVRRALAPVPGALPFARLVVEVFRICFRYRVTGLSAEAAFFMLLCLPPLILGLFAGVGFFADRFEPGALATVTSAIERFSEQFLTPQVVSEIIVPTVEDVLAGGRADLLSLGFLLSLWSGSRALHVFMDAIQIMYTQSGERSIVGARAMSLGLYLGSILFASVLVPLAIIGPGLLRDWLPDELDFLVTGYWPILAGLSLLGLTTLYHYAPKEKTPFHRDIPGAVVAAVIVFLSSLGVRAWAAVAVGGVTIFGPLTAPIIVLTLFYLVALAVLIGAATNAAIRRLWPTKGYRGPIERAGDWWDQVRSSDDEVPPHLSAIEDREDPERLPRRDTPPPS